MRFNDLKACVYLLKSSHTKLYFDCKIY